MASVLRGANLWMSVDDVPRSRQTWQLTQETPHKIEGLKTTRHRGPNAKTGKSETTALRAPTLWLTCSDP